MSKPDHQPQPSTALLKRPVPPASVEKARKMFKNFTLSKFTKAPLPQNHVAEPRNPTAVQVVQRKNITREIQTLNSTDPASPGMSLALQKGTIKKLLPSYDEKVGTIDLGDLLSLLRQRMKGTEFFSNRNPTLNRLALQSQVDQIIQSIKQEAKK